MRYTNSTELEYSTVYEGDDVIFTFSNGEHLNYSVGDSYLVCNGVSNDVVFHMLGINKMAFCRDHYGYAPYDGDWPESNSGDYHALTRAVVALFKIIEEGHDDKTSYEGSKIKFNFIKKRYMTY